MVNYGTDFSNKFEIINPGIHIDDDGENFIQLEFKLVEGIDNALQGIYNRLITHYGEFKLFQYYKFHNLTFDYFMKTNIKIAMIGMRLATIDCLESEPFVETVNNVTVTPNIKDNRAFIIQSNITLVGANEFNISYILRNDMTLDWISQTEDQIYET